MSNDHLHNDRDNDDNPERSSPREYRLVPVDEWPEAQGGTRFGSGEIDIRELSRQVWHRREFVAKVTAVFVVIGLLIALLSPVEYKTGATLLPENQQGISGAGNLLDQYGGLLGLGGSMKLDQQESIPPELYPDIVNSLPYQLEVLNKEIYYSRYDTTVTNYSFFDDIHSPSVLGYVKAYTLGLPGKIKGLFSEEGPEVPLPKGFEGDSIVSLTKHQSIIVNEMRGRINVKLDEESGLINITVTMPDPNAAAQIGQLSVNLLKEYITSYRTRKAQEDLEFTQEQMMQAREEWRAAQVRLADFQDQNYGQLTARAQTREQRLQSEYDLTFNKYNSLAQKVEQAKLRVQEKTPVVTVLKPIEMPVDNAEPRRRLIVILSLILGLLIAVGYVVVNQLRGKSDKDRVDAEK